MQKINLKFTPKKKRKKRKKEKSLRRCVSSVLNAHAGVAEMYRAVDGPWPVMSYLQSREQIHRFHFQLYTDKKLAHHRCLHYQQPNSLDSFLSNAHIFP